MAAWKKINKIISILLKIFMIVSFIYMTAALSIQVFGRYIFKTGFPWTEETARYIMIWAVFIGAGYIALNLEHVKVSILEDTMKKESGKLILYMIQNIVCFIFVFIVFKYSFSQITIAKLSVSANTGLSMLFPYMVFPVSMALLVYSYFYKIVECILKLVKKPVEEVKGES